MRTALPAAVGTALVALGCMEEPGPPSARVSIEPHGATAVVGSRLPFDVVVETRDALQAIELEVRTDWNVAVPVDVAPHPDFDDDGRLLGEASYDLAAQSVTLRDLRHGRAAASGPLRVATVWISCQRAGRTRISVEARLSGAGGEPFSIARSAPAILTVAPDGSSPGVAPD